MEPRVSLYVPREASFPIPLEYIDVTRATSTSLDVMLEKTSTIIRTLMEIDNCQIRGQGFTRFTVLDEKPPDGYTVRETDKKQTIPEQTLCGLTLGKICPMRRNAKRSKKWAIEKPKLDNATRLRGISFIDPNY